MCQLLPVAEGVVFFRHPTRQRYPVCTFLAIIENVCDKCCHCIASSGYLFAMRRASFRGSHSRMSLWDMGEAFCCGLLYEILMGVWSPNAFFSTVSRMSSFILSLMLFLSSQQRSLKSLNMSRSIFMFRRWMFRYLLGAGIFLLSIY